MKKRIIIKNQLGIYHCMSRVVHGRKLMRDGEKEVFRRMLHKVAFFCGVRVLTHSILSNHFHILAEVAPCNESELSDETLIARYKALYDGKSTYTPMDPEAFAHLLLNSPEEVADLKTRLIARMGDLSAFIQTLKQRFTIWYNRTHDTYGAFWSSRFKSLLVEGDGFPLQTVAAYIDLNAVRADLVKDPKDYRFCGYGEAAGGQLTARENLAKVMQLFGSDTQSRLDAYRGLLLGKGSRPGRNHMGEPCLEIKEGEALSIQAALSVRLKFMTDGVIFGSREFIDQKAEAIKAALKLKRPLKFSPLGEAFPGFGVSNNRCSQALDGKDDVQGS